VLELAPDDHHDHMVDVDTNEVLGSIYEEIERLQHLHAVQHGDELIDHTRVLRVRKKDRA